MQKEAFLPPSIVGRDVVQDRIFLLTRPFWACRWKNEDTSGGAYPGLASTLPRYAGWDGCEAVWTDRPKRPLFHPSGPSRSRYTTGFCCTSGWHGSRRISLCISSGIAGTPCPVLYSCLWRICPPRQVVVRNSDFYRWGLIFHPFLFNCPICIVLLHFLRSNISK